MNILKSVDARIKNYYLSNFERTKYGKNLSTLKNKYVGKRCFIIGNGPSLDAKDLDLLKNEYTFAFNRIYYMFDKTVWRPNFYCTQDIKIVERSIDHIKEKIHTPFIFAPINLKWYEGIDLQTDFYFSPKTVRSEDTIPFFCENIPHEIGMSNTVVYTAIQLAVYMGFRYIYLLGVDHNFHISQDKYGNIIKDDKVKDYFCEEYNKDKDELFIPKLDISALAYLAAQKFAQAHMINIYNATRGGKLEIFQRVDFDTLF